MNIIMFMVCCSFDYFYDSVMVSFWIYSPSLLLGKEHGPVLKYHVGWE